MSNQGGYDFRIVGTPVAGYPALTIRLANGGTEYIQGIHPVVVGTWNFVAVVVNPPTVTFYVGEDPGGGASSFTTSVHTLNGTPNASNTNPMYVGYNPQNPHIDISIDELEMFHAALSASELQQIWAADDEGKCRSVCTCGGFSKIAVRNKKGTLNKFLSCGNQPESLRAGSGLPPHRCVPLRRRRM